MAGERHPLHPATVHWPIVLLGTSYSLDIAYHYFPSSLGLPVLRQLPVAMVPTTSYFLLSLGLVSAVPAVLTGVQELIGMVARQDLGGKLKRSNNKLAVLRDMNPRLKIAFMHAIINDVAMVGSAYSWWTRGQVKGYVPDATHALTAVVYMLAVFGAATLGGILVYDYGVGVVGLKKAGKKGE